MTKILTLLISLFLTTTAHACRMCNEDICEGNPCYLEEVDRIASWAANLSLTDTQNTPTPVLSMGGTLERYLAERGNQTRTPILADLRIIQGPHRHSQRPIRSSDTHDHVDLNGDQYVPIFNINNTSEANTQPEPFIPDINRLLAELPLFFSNVSAPDNKPGTQKTSFEEID